MIRKYQFHVLPAAVKHSRSVSSQTD